MSLINDALKRARQSQPARRLSDGPPLAPVESRPSGGIGWALPSAIVLLVVAACVLVGLAVVRHIPPPHAAATVGVSAPPASRSAPVPAPPVSTPGRTPSPSAPPPASNAPPEPARSETNAPTVSSSVPPAPLPPPKPRLQGILFDPTAPCAIVNGRSVHVGDRVGKLRVKAISKSVVLLEAPDGTETHLRLGK